VPESVTYPDKAAARGALSGRAGSAANRFFRDATGKNTGFAITALDAGIYRLEFFSPARNPGYGKRYVEEIGPDGEVIREFKETLGPSGLIETKWVHGGPGKEPPSSSG